MKTTAGPLELERPRVRNASALAFASEIVGRGVKRTVVRCFGDGPDPADGNRYASRERALTID